MAAGDRRGSGSSTMTASGPGTVASKEVSIGSLDTADTVNVTIASTAQQSVTDQTGAAIGLEVVKESGKFTLYADRAQTPAIAFDYDVRTTA